MILYNIPQRIKAMKKRKYTNLKVVSTDQAIEQWRKKCSSGVDYQVNNLLGFAGFGVWRM